MSTVEQAPISPYSQPFWDGVAADELRLPWCESCGRPHFPPRPFCPHCWADADALEWRTASGRGTLYTYTIVRANPPSAFVDLLPYVIAIVRLEEGVQMMSHVEGDHALLACDAPLQVTWKAIHGRKLPAFVVAS